MDPAQASSRKKAPDKELPSKKPHQSRCRASEQDLREREILRLVNQARAHDEPGKMAREQVLKLKEIYLICRRIVENPYGWWTPYFTDVDDLHQEVRIRIDRYLPLENDEFDSARNFFKWVKAIARSQYFDGIRKNKRYSEGRKDFDGANVTGSQDSETINSFYNSVASGQVSDQDALINADLLDKLLARLPSEDVAILKAVYCDELTYEQVGEKFGIGKHREEVRRRIHRILDRAYHHYVALTRNIRTAAQINIAVKVSTGQTDSRSQSAAAQIRNEPDGLEDSVALATEQNQRKEGRSSLSGANDLQQSERAEKDKMKPLSDGEIAYLLSGFNENQPRWKHFSPGLLSLYVDGERYPEFNCNEEIKHFIIPSWASSLDVFGYDEREEILLVTFDLPELAMMAADDEVIELIASDELEAGLEVLIFPPNQEHWR